jgi:ribosomal protein L28
MKHHLRRFKVNTFKLPIYSVIMDKEINLNVSAKALRTIKYYGGLDNYLLQMKHENLDSALAKALKALISNKDFLEMSKESKVKQIDMLHLPGIKTKIHRKKGRKQKIEEKCPSVFIPVEALRTDLSIYHYPKSKFISRLEHEEINKINKEIETTQDFSRKNELRKQLRIIQKDTEEDLVEKILKIQPHRHKDIRDEFIRITTHLSDNLTTKLKYIEVLQNSENLCKVILKEQYKHYSEDYPEVQLILQRTEQQKSREVEVDQLSLKTYSQTLGSTNNLEKPDNQFDSYSGKVGRKYEFELENPKGNVLRKLQQRVEISEAKRGKKKGTKNKKDIEKSDNVPKKEVIIDI